MRKPEKNERSQNILNYKFFIAVTIPYKFINTSRCLLDNK